MLTGLDDDQLAARVVRGGAQDCLVKGRIDSDRLHKHFPSIEAFTRLGLESYLGIPLRNSQGKVIGSLCVLDDKPMPVESRTIIRIFAARAGAELERLQAERALKESEERYRTLFESSNDAILVTSNDQILAANPEACRVLGRTEEELTQIGNYAIIDKTDSQWNVAMEERIRAGKFKGELTFVAKDGNRFTGDVSTIRHRSKDGLCQGTWIIRDMAYCPDRPSAP